MKAYIKRSLLTILCGYLLAQIILTLLPSGTASAFQMSCQELAGGYLASTKSAKKKIDPVYALGTGTFIGYVSGFADRAINALDPQPTAAQLREYEVMDAVRMVGKFLNENRHLWRNSVTAHECVERAFIANAD